jgi:small-conductance mechanosensitive channel
MAEQPFVVDDVVQVGDAVGRVLSIDMLSVKLRTFDNRFVRIPNENHGEDPGRQP